MSVDPISQQQLTQARSNKTTRPKLNRPHLLFGEGLACGVALSEGKKDEQSWLQLVYCDSDYHDPSRHRETAICRIKHERELQMLLPSYIEMATAINELYEAKIITKIIAREYHASKTLLKNDHATLMTIPDKVSLQWYRREPHPLKAFSKAHLKIEKVLQQGVPDDFHARLVERSTVLATDIKRKQLMSQLFEEHPEQNVAEIMATVDQRIPVRPEESSYPVDSDGAPVDTTQYSL